MILAMVNAFFAIIFIAVNFMLCHYAHQFYVMAEKMLTDAKDAKEDAFYAMEDAHRAAWAARHNEPKPAIKKRRGK